MFLPCRDCGSLTVCKPKVLDGTPTLCDHCQAYQPTDAVRAQTARKRKPPKKSARAPAETYLDQAVPGGSPNPK